MVLGVREEVVLRVRGHSRIEQALNLFGGGAENGCAIATKSGSALTSIDGESNSFVGDCRLEMFSLFGSEHECVCDRAYACVVCV